MTMSIADQIQAAIADLEIDIECIDKHGHTGEQEWEVYREVCQNQITKFKEALSRSTWEQVTMLNELIRGA